MGGPLLYDIHGKRFSGPFSASRTNRGLLRQVANLNQQQLQNARTALWRQNGQPLLTQDDAAAWLEETGLCLFLPRHAQLPAPAPSFVEACGGVARAVPAPAAIDTAMGLVTRLVAEGRAVPLSLMGNLTEQPDFLATPETLRWVAAVRGDRNWKAAPGGRTAPLVQRVWEALDRAPGRTEPEIREELGRELTEGAVMRALVELWTTMRAAPEYIAGEPTRWTLMKDRYAREMAAGANTAQTTALSALISLYLRQAIAATTEEAEIFLSPLTARSRIREVLHGMLATRQFGTMAIGVQTLLYLEGMLPEFAEEETAPAEIAAAESQASAERIADGKKPEPRRERKPWSPSRPDSRPEFRPKPRREFRREPQRPFAVGPKREGRPAGGVTREFQSGEKRPFRPGGKPERGIRPKPGGGREKPREFGKSGAKPWEKRGGLGGQSRGESQPGSDSGQRREGRREFESGEKRPFRPGVKPERGLGPKPGGGRGKPREFGKSGAKPWEKRAGLGGQRRGGSQPGRASGQRREGSGEFRREGKPGGWQTPKRDGRESRPRESQPREEGRPEQREFRPENRRPIRPGDRPQGRREFRPENREARENRPAFRREGTGKPKFSGKPARPGGEDRRSARPGDRPGKRFGKPGAKFSKPGGRFGKPGGGARFGKPGGGRFRKSREGNIPRGSTGNKAPRPEARSGKNRKEQKDQPE
jgi:hypothetical protein